MSKTPVKASLLLLLCIFLASCYSLYSLEKRSTEKEYPEAKHDVITTIYREDGLTELIYQEKRYLLDHNNLFSVNEKASIPEETDVLLSWSGSLWWNTATYYAETELDPLFIFLRSSDSVFLREDYDYMADTFVIEGTDEALSLSEITDLDQPMQEHPHTALAFRLISKTNSRIKCTVRLYQEKDIWYSVLGYPSNTDAAYVTKLSPAIVQRLKNTGIIE